MRDRHRHRQPPPTDRPHQGYDSDDSDNCGADMRAIVNPLGGYAALPPSDMLTVSPYVPCPPTATNSDQRTTSLVTESWRQIPQQTPVLRPHEPHVKQPGANRLSHNNSGHCLSHPPSFPSPDYQPIQQRYLWLRLRICVRHFASHQSHRL